ncbi:hypothetical protein ALC62_02265 [Cyphomyrmex costatus]|uniref:Mutator-like transposase domain-containing protein n=1 Tax=Cyphomyrmex costatus TaxID=456900 RepID=A0A151IN57_9HYME|nr:hypothetical protein ALC62_02265 [Cyphomyrmex costatus]
MDRKGKKRQTKSPGDSAKKRKFHDNQHTSELCTDFVSTSANKLKNQDDFEPAIDESSTYVVLCFSLVFTALQSVLQCKVCNSGIQFLKQSQVGLGFTLCIKCKCNEMFTVHSCPKLRNAYEINRRFTYAMRLLGVGLAGINLFCSLMDLGTGLSKNGYYNIIQNIHVAAKAVSTIVFKKAVKEEIEKNRLVSLVGNYSNKVVDVIVKSKVCKACEKWVALTQLEKDDLLKRCLGRNTQNNNEAFNHCVWNLAPKHIFVGQKTLEIAAWTTACTFNEGFLPVLKIMETMGVTIGPHARAYANMYDSRISTTEKNAVFTSKEARIARRSQKVAQNDNYEETEGLLYAPGIAD